MIIIRPETNRDIPVIEALILIAFKDHPHQDPQKGTVEHLIIYQLRQTNALTISLVATEDNQVVGHIAFSPITIDGKDQNWFVLAPVSVLPSHQNQGIGKALIQAGLQQLKDQNANGCVVLGEPDYYQKFGFQAQNALVVDGVPQEYFMAKTLCAEKIPQGKVQFHPAFSV
ncbi:GNAT family N-acetyltransferase [Wohlfahrtiimonas populi]|uniref:GNAT family N-acetyltransferase n=1 Tax=Wohlfahrtiimonas populi TaxID=1940240 RepID=UPI001E37B29E|nr:N-acetyltransferase [Wohlfahrtiimonas populi]